MIRVLVDDDFMVARVHSAYVGFRPCERGAHRCRRAAHDRRTAPGSDAARHLYARYRWPDCTARHPRISRSDRRHGDQRCRRCGHRPRRGARWRAALPDQPFSDGALYDHLRHFAALHAELGVLSRAAQSDVDEVSSGVRVDRPRCDTGGAHHPSASARPRPRIERLRSATTRCRERAPTSAARQAAGHPRRACPRPCIRAQSPRRVGTRRW